MCGLQCRRAPDSRCNDGRTNRFASSRRAARLTARATAALSWSVCFREAGAETANASVAIELGKAAAGDAQVVGLNAHASHVLIGSSAVDGVYLDAAEVPTLHQKGLRGHGQVVGLGDTGLDINACGFADPQIDAPFNKISAVHRKVAAYYTTHGDFQDGPDGHGTHVAGSIAGELVSGGSSSSTASVAGAGGRGVAPAARLVVVDLEDTRKPGLYNVPANDIAGYFELMRNAGAAVACSPWGFDERQAGLEEQVDRYVAEHPEFLPVFPSGNTNADPVSPCRAKNVLCVGAAFNAKQSYEERPSFARSALQVGDAGCMAASAPPPSSQRLLDCAVELRALPALFGPTAPKNAEACQQASTGCLVAQSACPECAFPKTSLSGVVNKVIAEANPSDACEPLQSFLPGAVCLAVRGGCAFVTKVRNCENAGAVGAIVVNTVGSEEVLMNGDSFNPPDIPSVIVQHTEAEGVLFEGQRVTFPVIADTVSPRRRAPYSSFTQAAPGSGSGSDSARLKPEVILPGDGIVSLAASEACGLRSMSGTSQSCGLAAGMAALLREYLQVHADATHARLATPWASSLRALLVVSASSASAAPRLFDRDVGFGLPVLSRLLPFPASPPPAVPPGSAPAPAPPPPPQLVVLQSAADASGPQRYCFAVDSADRLAVSAATSAQISLVWTDPPSADNELVNDLDLEVSCVGADGLQGYKLGNGGSGPDRVNTVEKITLGGLPALASALCVVTVRGSRVSSVSAQPFSLVVSGPVSPRHGCEAPSEVAQLPCAHGSTGTTGVLIAGAHGLKSASGCVCESPWVGPLCAHRSVDLGPPVVVGGPASARLQIRPWQWTFFDVSMCGSGAYEFVLEHEDDGLVSGGASGLLLAAAALAPSGEGLSMANLWSSHHATSSAGSDEPSTWQDKGVQFSVIGESTAHSDLATFHSGEKLRHVVLAVHVAPAIGAQIESLRISIFNKGRAGPAAYAMRWQQREVTDPEGRSALGCPSAAQVAAAADLRQSIGIARGAGDNEENNLPSGVLVALLVTFCILCVLGGSLGAAWKMGVAPSSKWCCLRQRSSRLAVANADVDMEEAQAATPGPRKAAQTAPSRASPLQQMPSSQHAHSKPQVAHATAVPNTGLRAAALVPGRPPPRPPRRPPPASQAVGPGPARGHHPTAWQSPKEMPPRES